MFLLGGRATALEDLEVDEAQWHEAQSEARHDTCEEDEETRDTGINEPQRISERYVFGLINDVGHGSRPSLQPHRRIQRPRHHHFLYVFCFRVRWWLQKPRAEIDGFRNRMWVCFSICLFVGVCLVVLWEKCYMRRWIPLSLMLLATSFAVFLFIFLFFLYLVFYTDKFGYKPVCS